MRSRSFVLCTVIAGGLASTGAVAQSPSPSGLNADVAEKMAAACMAYAKARNAAVNIWIYDSTGGVLRFQRMDGAPPVGAPDGSFSGSGMIGGRFDDAMAFSATAPGAVTVIRNGRTIGTVRATGMGAIGDRACARAAADATGMGSAGQPPGG